jgi:hypothetical protein
MALVEAVFSRVGRGELVEAATVVATDDGELQERRVR